MDAINRLVQASGSGGQPAGGAGAINLDTEVRSGGKVYKLSELVAAAEKAQELETVKTKAQEQRELLSRLYGPRSQIDKETFERDFRALLADNGWEGEALEENLRAAVQSAFGDPAAEGKETTPPTTTTPPNNSNQASPPVTHQTPSPHEQFNQYQLEQMLAKVIGDRLGTHETTSKYLKALSGKRDEKDVAKLTDMLRAKGVQNLQRILLEDKRRTGHLDFGKIAEKVDEALQPVSDELGVLYGKPEDLGGADTAVADTFGDLLNTAPKDLEVPDDAHLSDAETLVDDYTVDALSRAAAQQLASESASVA